MTWDVAGVAAVAALLYQSALKPVVRAMLLREVVQPDGTLVVEEHPAYGLVSLLGVALVAGGLSVVAVEVLDRSFIRFWVEASVLATTGYEWGKGVLRAVTGRQS